jgi:hypothetical protein
MTSAIPDFWYDDPARDGAAESEIAQAERHVGHKFPREHRALLLLRDGGVSNYPAVRLSGRLISLLPFLGVGASSRSGDIARGHDLRTLEGRPGDVVVFAAQGESWWGFDYSGSRSTPGIVWHRDDETGTQLVADSFEEFLDGLVEDFE